MNNGSVKCPNFEKKFHDMFDSFLNTPLQLNLNKNRSRSIVVTNDILGHHLSLHSRREGVNYIPFLESLLFKEDVHRKTICTAVDRNLCTTKDVYKLL